MPANWLIPTLTGVVRVLIILLGGWLAKLGFTAEQIDQAVTPLAGALVAFLVTVGWALYAAWNKQQSLPLPNAGDRRAAGSMDQFRNVGIIALPLMLLMVGGCSQTPVSRAYQLRASFNDGMEETLRLHKVGVVPAAVLRVINSTARATEPLLDEMDRAALTGDAFKFEAAYRSASRGVEEILRWLARARNRV